MTPRVEEISELNISSCMLTEYINGVQTVVNSASPTNYYLQSVIYGDEDNDPEMDDDFFNVRGTDSAVLVYRQSSGDYSHARGLQTVRYSEPEPVQGQERSTVQFLLVQIRYSGL